MKGQGGKDRTREGGRQRGGQGTAWYSPVRLERLGTAGCGGGGGRAEGRGSAAWRRERAASRAAVTRAATRSTPTRPLKNKHEQSTRGGRGWCSTHGSMRASAHVMGSSGVTTSAAPLSEMRPKEQADSVAEALSTMFLATCARGGGGQGSATGCCRRECVPVCLVSSVRRLCVLCTLMVAAVVVAVGGAGSGSASQPAQRFAPAPSPWSGAPSRGPGRSPAGTWPAGTAPAGPASGRLTR